MAAMIVVFPDGSWTPMEDARIVSVSDDEIESRCLHSPIPTGEPASVALTSLETAMEGKAPKEVALHVRMLLTRYADPQTCDLERDSIRREMEVVYLKAIGLGEMFGHNVDCTTDYQRKEEPWTLKIATD